MTHRTRICWIVPAICVVIGAGPVGADGPAPAPPPDHDVEPHIDHAEFLWQETGPERGTGFEYVAVVVWEESEEQLYSSLSTEIDRYAQDIADAGFTTQVFKFHGMAVDYCATPCINRDSHRFL